MRPAERGCVVHNIRILLLAGAALSAQPAIAADALKFGAPPAWVHPQAIPASKPSEAPISLLLADQQTTFERGKVTTYAEGAFKIENAQGLAAGNITLTWQPSTDAVTVNKLQIRRGDKIIDVLASGQTFTTLRRETNLDAATLDGTLTATLQPEGLQVGDIIDLATTTERSDPVLKGHVETMFGAWDGLPIESAHAAISWPSDIHLQIRETPNLPAAKRTSANGIEHLELSAENVQPLIPPKGAPERFQIGRLAEATDYQSWSDIASLFEPLFKDASAIPASGPLHDEVEKIRVATTDPKKRAEQTLSLVQDRVRYVALLMGQGSLVPATAETTWSRRFGDCKAKTALLLGILHSLGIVAEPVLAQVKLGDMIADRLPMVALFNHVLVRAHIGGKDYWLDGTRTGDTDLDSIEVPDFGWGLPLVQHAALVKMVPAPLTKPSLERHIAIDASSGVLAPASVTIDETYRGDSAVEMNTLYSAATPQQRDEALHNEAKNFFDDFATASSSVQFDGAKREFHMSMKGSAKLNWKDGWLFVPTSSIGFDPDFDRTAGPLHDVPMAVNHPSYTKDEATISLPAGFAAQQKLDAPIRETLAGVEYARSETVDGNVLTVDSSERSLVDEVPYKDALAAASRLKALDKDDVYIDIPGSYRETDKDLAELQSQQPSTAIDYFLRAHAYLDHQKPDQALADLNAGLALDPKNIWALRSRAGIYEMKERFDDARKDVAAGLAIQPTDNDLLLMQAMLASNGTSIDPALDRINQLLLSNPKNVEARLQHGWLLNGKGDFDGAIHDFSAVLDQDPKNVVALAARAFTLARKHDFASAKRDLAAAEAIDPSSQGVTGAKAQLAREQNDLAGVAATYSSEIAAHPQDGGGYLARANAFYADNKLDLALADVDRAIALGLKSVGVRVLRANLLVHLGKPDAVAHEAELMVQENPGNSYALVGAGKTYAAIGQREKAMQALDAALAIKPEAYIYINRSQVRPATDLTGQIADLDEALKLDPTAFDALQMKAALLVKQAKYDEALALYDRIPESPANRDWIEAQRAITLHKAGRTAEAEQKLAALRTKAKTADDLNNVCWAEGTAKFLLDQAIQECRDAVKMSNGAAQYADSLGMALLQSGKLDEALAVYTQALAKRPYASSYMGRAIIEARRGDSARARADLAEAKKLDIRVEDEFADYGLKFDDSASKKPEIVSVTKN
jgi:tetratricopeptide (TPR) repeat protein